MISLRKSNGSIILFLFCLTLRAFARNLPKHALVLHWVTLALDIHFLYINKLFPASKWGPYLFHFDKMEEVYQFLSTFINFCNLGRCIFLQSEHINTCNTNWTNRGTCILCVLPQWVVWVAVWVLCELLHAIVRSNSHKMNQRRSSTLP